MENNIVRLSDEEVAVTKSKLTELKETLENQKKDGFKKLPKKEVEALEKKIQETAQALATEYLERYTALCQQFSIEVRAVMKVNPYQPNVAQAMTELRPYIENTKPKTKPWHEAMADNLHTRAKCEHVLHDEGLVCEKCGLPPDKWGKDGKGVSAEYHEEQKARIEKEKQAAEEAETKE